MKLPYRHIFANQDLRDLSLFVEGVDKHWTLSYLRSALQQKKSTPPDGSSSFQVQVDIIISMIDTMSTL